MTDTTNEPAGVPGESGLSLEEFNSASVNNLYSILNKIYSSNNLLILDQSLSPFLNSLTTFSKLKEHGRFQNIIWLNNDINTHGIGVFKKFSSLIILIEETNANLVAVEELLVSKTAILDKIDGLKINIIVKDLSRSYLYEINKALRGSILDFNTILGNQKKLSINVTPRVKVLDWETYPVFNDGILLVDIRQFGGIDTYFEEPLKQVKQLVDSVVKLLFANNGPNNNLLKLRNIYGKGNHADFLIQLLQDVKIPEYLNMNLNKLEIEFYRTKLISNTDLIVLERNMDFYSVLFNQLNYHGLIDDLFELKFNTIVKSLGEVEEPISMNLNNDELYTEQLKHLNFASVGPKLNKLAKEVQHSFKLKDAANDNNNTNLKDIRKIVNNLGNLTLQQDLIKKHTTISEAILHRINTEYETFLSFQNDIFEMDYKLQLSKLKYFFNINYDKYILLTSIILISIVNDGIKERDFEWISHEILDNYGMGTSLALEKLVENKVIKLIIDQGTDFLSTITGGLAGNQQAAHPIDESQSLAKLGISGAQETYRANFTLIDKFWNLHPLDEEEDDTIGLSIKETLVDMYPNPSFTLPSNTVPLTSRIVESLYFRDFLKYKPVNNIKKRPNWENLGIGSMFNGKTVDINIDDKSDVREKKKVTIENTQEYVIVVLLGGITRSEITCLKYLQERLHKSGKSKKIVVITSGIVNNKKFLDYFLA
ncbi:vacuolar sorting protein VPS33/slp1 [Scheffersomyces xylosifermentans]|uniref:vacuolar sorting protein VPS33/slp1 n=1 Tax=Scheffersomyces xylosifermentans TaxID=1304137 RepID=UPI00315DE286